MTIFASKPINFVLFLLVALAIHMPAAQAASKEITIGYQTIFNPWKVAIYDKAFEKATGYKITWRKFTTGIKAIKAMSKGKVQMTAAGSSPIAAAASGGVDIELFWILEDIGAGEALIARNGAGIFSPQNLRGKKIAVPPGSTAHFHLLFALEQFGIGQDEVTVMKLQPTSIATVWKSERIDAAFVWAPTLNKIKQTGRVIITSGQISQWGKATFDGLIVDKKWAKANPEFMVNFVRTIAAYDANYRTHRAAWSGTSNRVKKIAKLAGGNPIDIPHTLSLYKFPTIKQQASSRWLGGGALGGAARALRHTAKFLNKQKKLKNVLDDYGNAVNPQWVKAALRQ